MRIKYDIKITYFHNNIELLHIYDSIKSNILNGEHIDWYSNGNLLEHCFYKKGEVDGDYTTYFKDYNVFQQYLYENGKIVEDMR